MDKKLNKTSEAKLRANKKWQRENYSRIPLDVPKEEHAILKEIAQKHNMSLNGYIKQAILEKREREGDI